MTDWFGKGCSYLYAEWAEGYAQVFNRQPVTMYCNHRRNRIDEEGNCCKSLCPIKGDSYERATGY